MKSDFDAALDRSLVALAAGSTLDACLERYPEHAAELKTLLQLAVDLQHVATPSPSPSARAAGQQRMLAALAARSRRRPVLARFWERSVAALRAPAWHPAVVVLLVVLVAAAGLALAASTTALPGDHLYAVKVARQDIQLALALDPARQEMLASQFATDRRRDVYSALEQGRSAPVQFEGILESMDGERWLVSSLPVAVSPTTDIDGEPAPGVPVEIRGRTSDAGYVVAFSIDVDSDHAPWPAPTDTPRPTSTPSATPTHTPTRTPVSTHTPTNTPSPSPAPDKAVEPTPSVPATTLPPTAEPTAAPEATEALPTLPAPSPTPTLHLSATPSPTDIPPPRATATPTVPAQPTEAPSPTATPTPSTTPEPTATPTPSMTPKPTDTPEPTDTPKPTSTPEPGDDDDVGVRLARPGVTRA